MQKKPVSFRMVNFFNFLCISNCLQGEIVSILKKQKFLQCIYIYIFLITGKKKVHFKFRDGREMVEEYSVDTNCVVRRAWKVTKQFGFPMKWEVEIGDPDHVFSEESENIGIKESSTAVSCCHTFNKYS